MFIGALSLDGTVEKVEGMLPALIAAKSLGFKRAYLPYDHMNPLDMLQGLECIVVQHNEDVLNHLSGKEVLPLCLSPQKHFESSWSSLQYSKDYCDIIGHEQAKQAFEIVAAREHKVKLP